MTLRNRAWLPFVIAGSIFLATRALIFSAIMFAINFVPMKIDDGTREVGFAWYHHLFHWDAGWFLLVANAGYNHPTGTYEARGAAFFPLYPLIGRGVAWLGLETPLALLVVANVAALASSVILFALVRKRYDEETGYLAVAFMGLFPTSLFFSAGYSESLTLLLCLTSFLLIDCQHLVGAAALAGLAAATRSTGLVMLPILLLESWKQNQHSDLERRLPHLFLCAILAASGLIIYIAYLGFTVGEPMRFASAQAYWHSNTTFTARFLKAAMLVPLFTWKIGFFYFAGSMTLLLVFWRRLDLSQLLFGFGVLLLPYFTLVGGPASWTSMPRFVILAFPIYIALALLCRRRPLLAVAAGAISAVILFSNSVMFSQWYWVG